MKRFATNVVVLAMAVAGLGCMAFAQSAVENAPAAQGTPAQRQQNQRERIRNGAQNGSLTRAEAQRLRREEAGLHKQVRRDRADGGGLTARERAKTQAHANAVSRDIQHLKHNNRTR